MTVDISIHAPMKGATRVGFKCTKRKGDFNPRTREGCDDYLHGQHQDFNPRTREGCDLTVCGAPVYCGQFQSTHP